MQNGYGTSAVQAGSPAGYISPQQFGAVPDRGQPLLSEIRDSIADATKQVLGLMDSCRGVADNVFGPVPSTPGMGAATGNPPMVSRAMELRDHLAMLHGAIGVLRIEVQRLQSL